MLRRHRRGPNTAVLSREGTGAFTTADKIDFDGMRDEIVSDEHVEAAANLVGLHRPFS
jgi:hypothetical protein